MEDQTVKAQESNSAVENLGEKSISLPLTSAEQREMAELSKLFFGSSSRAEKFVKKGRPIQEFDSKGKALATEAGIQKVTLRRIDGKTLLNQLRAAKLEFDKKQEDRRKMIEAMEAAKAATGAAT